MDDINHSPKNTTHNLLPPGHESPDQIPAKVKAQMDAHAGKDSFRTSEGFGQSILEHEHNAQSNGQVEDFGHNGVHAHDAVVVANAHPHQQHSVGYAHADSPRHTSYEQHGLEAIHIVHHSRDKNAEHHGPSGLKEIVTHD